MGKDQNKDLMKFLRPFDKGMQEKALQLREFVWDLHPEANELIYDNYNALAIGWSPTDRVGHTFCSIALSRTNENVHFGFYWGSEIADPEKKLIGNGNQYRYLLVKSMEDFPRVYITKLIRAANRNSMGKIKDPRQIVKGLTITKSVSATKRKAGKKSEKIKK
jgi:hypothetical protein